MKKEAILALIGLALVGAGVFWWKTGGTQEDKIEILESKAEETGKIKIDIEGAVRKPGMYEIEAGTRTGEVLGLAGGLSNEADTKWIEMYLNRAEMVKDGQKIYIPRAGEQESVRAGVETESGKININTAAQAQLEELPGIGPVTAKKIIDSRPYGRVEELVEKKVVGQKVWEQIKESVSVW